MNFAPDLNRTDFQCFLINKYNNLGRGANPVPLAAYLPAQHLAEPNIQMQALGQPKHPRQKSPTGSPDQRIGIHNLYQL